MRRKITATELARNLSSFLSEVRYRSVSLEVWRGREVVALVNPPDSDTVVGFPVERLGEFFAGLPRLARGDATSFLDDLDAIDRTTGTIDDPWRS